jgi:hypothetical protein
MKSYEIIWAGSWSIGFEHRGPGFRVLKLCLPPLIIKNNSQYYVNPKLNHPQPSARVPGHLLTANVLKSLDYRFTWKKRK